MNRKRIFLFIPTVFLFLFSMVFEAHADEPDINCAGINKIAQTLSYEINSVDDHLIEVVTDEGSIYLEENTSACSYVLFLVIDNVAAVADLDFVNKQNVENRFGFLTLQDKKLVFENHVLMPYENEFLFKVYFRLFKGEADKINANLKDVTNAHKKSEQDHQRSENMLANTKT